jgi:nucleotide-binding universal stress UspA family protein/predicted GNAT family acetyltransferase
MFRRVLVATDFSAHADSTLECIGEIPGMEEILLVHVISGTKKAPSSSLFQSSRTSPQKSALAALNEKRAVLEGMTGVPVVSRIIEATGGDIAGAIIGLAHAENIPLIVMGGRGKGLISRYILGSVSEGVVQRSSTDVLIMHFKGAKDPGTTGLEKFCRGLFFHVLCPVDFSRPSQKTLEYAESLKFIRRMTLLHIMDEGMPEPDRGRREEECRQQLDAIVSGLAARGIRAAFVIRSGSPASEIAKVAEELDVSLILIARLGQSDYIRNVSIGRVAGGVAARAERPLFIVNPHISLSVSVKELQKNEFFRAEDLWLGYHQQKADPETDRVFGVFAENTLVAAARCRRHPDGLEVDAVYVPDDFRGRGYARMVVKALVDNCGNEPLFMHATLDLIRFYATLGFIEIGEHELPPSIRERFSFANGELKGANVQPMRRPAPATARKTLS